MNWENNINVIYLTWGWACREDEADSQGIGWGCSFMGLNFAAGIIAVFMQ